MFKTNQPAEPLPISDRRAFSLIKLIATVVILAVLAGAIAPALGQIRHQARALTSAENLMQIGQSRDLYASENTDRIFTYTWRAGETYTMSNGQVRTPNSAQEAASRQNEEIFMRRTQRISGVSKIRHDSARLTHHRFVHVVLMDYMAGDDDASFANPVFVDPADGGSTGKNAPSTIFRTPVAYLMLMGEFQADTTRTRFGSNSQASSGSSRAVHPTNPNGPVWKQRQVPLHVFSIPMIGGFGSNRELDMRSMWTKNGLQGFDYEHTCPPKKNHQRVPAF